MTEYHCPKFQVQSSTLPEFRVEFAPQPPGATQDQKSPRQLGLIVFDYMITDMLIIKKLNPIVTELFIRGSEINISLIFITQSYFSVSKNIRLNFRHNFIMKIPTK